MESKKLGGNIRSSLHNIIGISSLSCNMSSYLSVIEVNSLKKLLNLVNACHTFCGSNSPNAIGSNLCIKTWQSWLFIPNNFSFCMSIHLPCNNPRSDSITTDLIALSIISTICNKNYNSISYGLSLFLIKKNCTLMWFKKNTNFL